MNRTEAHLLAWRAQELNDATGMAFALNLPLPLAKAVMLRAAAVGVEVGPMATANTLAEMVDAALGLHAEPSQTEARLIVELRCIAEANPSTWHEDTRDQFQPWAQNRARAALAAAGVA